MHREVKTLAFLCVISSCLAGTFRWKSQYGHMRLLAGSLMIVWNSTGHATNLSGFIPYMVELVAYRMNFSYSYVPLGREWPLDNSPDGQRKGLVGLLAEGQGDLIVAGLLRTLDRFRLVELTMPVNDGPYSIMIPFPERMVNKNAISKPFQEEVWIWLLASFVVVILMWYLFKKVVFQSLKARFVGTISSEDSNDDIFIPFSYSLTVLLSQGNQCLSRYFSVRLIAGVWCFASFVLVPAYSGDLLSHILAPTIKPLVDSIYDIVHVPGLRVALDTGRAVDLRLIAASTMNSSFGQVAASIQKTIFRCNKSSDCIDKVLHGGFVYIHGGQVVDQMLADDYLNTKKCRFAKAKESFAYGYLTWGLPKKSPYLEDFNKGILELDAFGLSNYWKKRYIKVPVQCLKSDDIGSSKVRRITLPELSSTFMLVGVGCCLALIAFLFELCLGKWAGRL